MDAYALGEILIPAGTRLNDSHRTLLQLEHNAFEGSLNSRQRRPSDARTRATPDYAHRHSLCRLSPPRLHADAPRYSAAHRVPGHVLRHRLSRLPVQPRSASSRNHSTAGCRDDLRQSSTVKPSPVWLPSACRSSSRFPPSPISHTASR
ncbi:MAG UNVERIFIED_CONTAM: hypothetical protein LVR18_14675 [Planctomycetaceae bacterium]